MNPNQTTLTTLFEIVSKDMDTLLNNQFSWLFANYCVDISFDTYIYGNDKESKERYHFLDRPYLNIDATSYYRSILRYYGSFIQPRFPCSYSVVNKDKVVSVLSDEYDHEMIGFYHLGHPFIISCALSNREMIHRVIDTKMQSLFKNEYEKANLLLSIDQDSVVNYLYLLDQEFEAKQLRIIEKFRYLYQKYNTTPNFTTSYFQYLLENSWYQYTFSKEIITDYNTETHILTIEYKLPSKEEVPNSIESGFKWMSMSDRTFNKTYENIMYAIILRTISEIFLYDTRKIVENVCFNGKTYNRNPATGQREERYVASILVSRAQIEGIDYDFVDPKVWFKMCKGVASSKLYESIAITPITIINKEDPRIVNSKKIETVESQNLAEMNWEDFEHLVRQVFEWEFSDKNAEVNVTQSSRDGGVDAIIFDPDPIRGGKIIIQAKRYTNTVPVSAVRDLYGTIINEGANKGILITTSDYGKDSYRFAQGKPITLLNGGHLLYLLNKHGHLARIDLQEAKEKLNDNHI